MLVPGKDFRRCGSNSESSPGERFSHQIADRSPGAAPRHPGDCTRFNQRTPRCQDPASKSHASQIAEAGHGTFGRAGAGCKIRLTGTRQTRLRPHHPDQRHGQTPRKAPARSSPDTNGATPSRSRQRCPAAHHSRRKKSSGFPAKQPSPDSAESPQSPSPQESPTG